MALTNNSGNFPVVESSWPRLDLLNIPSEKMIRNGLPHWQLSPTWQMLILGDGSPTRHLQLLTGEKIVVDVIDMSPTQEEPPEEIEQIENPRILRQVWLKTVSGEKLAYAASWWAMSQVDEYLQNRSLPIWDSLSILHTELYRDVRQLYCGHSAFLSEQFAQNSPFWGRHYLFWHRQQPLTLIYEVFSPVLEKYLGKLSINLDDRVNLR